MRSKVTEIFENDITHLTKIITKQDLRSELLLLKLGFFGSD